MDINASDSLEAMPPVWKVLGYYCVVVRTGRNDRNGGFDREVCNIQRQRATKKRGIERGSEGYIALKQRKSEKVIINTNKGKVRWESMMGLKQRKSEMVYKETLTKEKQGPE